MTIKEKIACSSDLTRFTLFKEGMFFKCYNEDAMVFVTKVKPYKVSAKFVKNIGENVYNIGFPAGQIDKNGTLNVKSISEKTEAQQYEITDSCIVFSIHDSGIKNGYNSWLSTLEYHDKYHKEDAIVINDDLCCEDAIHTMIKNYDLANSTPMQSMYFIEQLKEAIRSLNKNNGNV